MCCRPLEITSSSIPGTCLGRKAPAYYSDSTTQFVAADPDQVLGLLTAANPFSLEPRQKEAWQEEIQILRAALQAIAGSIYLEFDLPRLGSRIDAVIVSGPAVFPIEFKCGEIHYSTADYNQAWDYALDLKNFHRASHDHCFPDSGRHCSGRIRHRLEGATRGDDVRPPRRCNAADLAAVVIEALAIATGPDLDSAAWGARPITRRRRSSRRRERSTPDTPLNPFHAAKRKPRTWRSPPLPSKGLSTAPAQSGGRPSSSSPACLALAKRSSA